MVLPSSTGTTPCPDCGRPMGLTTWVGAKPKCAACSGATVTRIDLLGPRLGEHNGEDDESLF